ncbi:hypothetical protein F6X40_10125 [Paraburkholderia sp. UCT31]|uniref:hypothetical protein n=1 Tax=Paraburkholderia sp. UCT31 TaxID=2615209 RepID=UPI00165613FA|nr:hypothetical protein [Paraburkholderia sp. UCT31]MBC8737164.1 hypothetical protein [Paraburkholderia sp. UCT31]
MEKQSKAALSVLRKAWVSYVVEKATFPLALMAIALPVLFAVWFFTGRSGLELVGGFAVGSLLLSYVFRALGLEFMGVLAAIPATLLVPPVLMLLVVGWGLGALIGAVRLPAVLTGRRIERIEPIDRDAGDDILFRITLRNGEVFTISHWPMWEEELEDYASACVVGKRTGRSGSLGYVLGNI